MKRPLALVGTLAVSAGLLAGTLAGPLAGASSHREAPMIANDPAADLTDLYAFVSPDKPDTATFIVNAIPYQEAMAGPNYYKFDDKVRYELHLSNDGGANADITYRVTFNTTVKNPNTFLYQTGPFSEYGDATLNVQQTATVTRVGVDGTETVVGANLPTQPVDIGGRTSPNGPSATDHISTLPNNDGWFYAGQRGDPFFLDLGVFDLLALRPLGPAHLIPTPAEAGSNHFYGYNVHTIALQVPLNKLTMDGQAPGASNGVIGVWATTSRRQTRVLSESGYGTADSGPWIQIERLGNPLVNEVVVPLGAKDHFNATPPSGDAEFLPAVLDPELGRLIPALYPGVTVPSAPRNDLVTIFLTGIPGLNQPANVTPSEMLRLNLAVKPTADIGKGARMGVLAGDTAGYPNGRRLEDDVVDIALQAIVGATPFTPEFNKSPNNIIGDGVNTSAQGFNTSFPYVSAPYQGYSHGHHTP